MQNDIKIDNIDVEDVPYGFNLTPSLFEKIVYSTLALALRIVLNIVPNDNLKFKIRCLKNLFISKTYKFFDVKGYEKYKNTTFETYALGNNKVSVLRDFYVSVYEDLSYLHDEDSNILIECASMKKYNIFANKTIHLKHNKIVDIDEAVVFALETEHNYWHFTFHCIDKLINLEERGFSGKYLVFDDTYIEEIIVLAGISKGRIVKVHRNDIFRVKKLHVVDDYFKTDYIALQKAKNKILSNIDFSNIDNYPKRLFVRRISPYTRTMINEKEVIELLTKYGFKTIFPDDYSVEEQIKYFNAADIVVTPHGANSTNALYMRENTHFIECFGNYYITPCMLDIIQDNKMFYNMIIPSINIERNYINKKIFGRHMDYSVNLQLLEDTIYNL